MFNAPFIMKVRFYEPTSENQGKNAGHVQYIGTRSGADRTDTHLELDETEFEISPDTPEGHAKYANERPGSHGLFDQDSSSKPDIREVQRELKGHNGIVWRMVLSLREDDAIRLGYTNKKQWEQMLRATVDNAAHKMKIKPTNLRWVAAFHEEKGHPHVHLMIWEKEPKRSRGVLSKGEKEDVKRIFVNQIYAEERTRLYQEQTAIRDYIRDFSKDEVVDSVKLMNDLEKSNQNILTEMRALGQVPLSIAPRLHEEENLELIFKLNELSEKIPDKGRIALGYMPEDVRKETLDIADWLLKQPQFKPSVDQYLSYAEELASHYSFQESDILKARENAYKDLQKRVGQLVLKGGAEAKQSFNFRINEMTIRMIKPYLENAQTSKVLPADRLSKNLQTFSRILTVSGYEKEQSLEVLRKWVERSDLSFDKEGLEKAIDKAIAHREERQTWGKDIVISPKEWERFFRDIGVNDKQTPKWAWSKYSDKGASKTIAHSLVKSTWRSLEKEQQKAEAKAMIERRKLAQESVLSPEQKKRLQQAKKRNRERDQEYE